LGQWVIARGIVANDTPESAGSLASL